VDERPSLGFSSIGKTKFATTAGDKLRRLAFIAVGIAALGGVFYYLTRAVESSTAHATSDDSALHTDQ
jgi:mannose/fructose/N-acetylgalactosamine-specific phosphotransferase system component IIC